MKSVIICDMEGLILKMNNGAEKVFGYKPDELIGKKRVSIFSPGEIVIQNVLNWLKIANTKGVYEAKTNFIKKDGTLFNAKCKITPNFSNGKNNPQTGYCGITEVIDEEILFNSLGRIRNVVSAPDGSLVLAIDSRKGKIIRVVPNN